MFYCVWNILPEKSRDFKLFHFQNKNRILHRTFHQILRTSIAHVFFQEWWLQEKRYYFPWNITFLIKMKEETITLPVNVCFLEQSNSLSLLLMYLVHTQFTLIYETRKLKSWNSIKAAHWWCIVNWAESSLKGTSEVVWAKSFSMKVVALHGTCSGAEFC